MTDSLSQARRWVEDGMPPRATVDMCGVSDVINKGWVAKYGSDPLGVIKKALSASVPGCGCEHCTKASIAIGIAQAAHGMMVNLGSFAEYWAGSVQQEGPTDEEVAKVMLEHEKNLTPTNIADATYYVRRVREALRKMERDAHA